MEASATDGTLMEIYKTDMEHFGFDGMRVKQEIFIPVIWGMISVSSLFLLLRFCTRWRTFGRFFADDVFALLAWLCAATMGVLAVHMASAMYYIIERSMSSASASVGPEILTTIRKFTYGVNFSLMLMYTSLWCVKLSFLLFFYKLGPQWIRAMKWHWWAVAVFTMLSYVASFATYPYVCSFGSFEQITSRYCIAEQNMSFVNIKVNTTLDVVTDFLIVTIPLNILWRSRIPFRQSLALGAVFSLVLVTIAFALIRAMLSTVGVTKQLDAPWVLVWSAAEVNIAIVVACFGSCRMLYIRNRKEEGRRHVEIRLKRRTLDRTIALEQTVVVDEMTSVERSARSSEMGRVESTVGSTLQNSMVIDSTVSRPDGCWPGHDRDSWRS